MQIVMARKRSPKKGNALKGSLYPESAIANIDDGVKFFAAPTDGLMQLGVARIERVAEIGLAESVAA